MSLYQKLRRTLKRPDAFQVLVLKIFKKCEDNARVIVGVLGAVVVLSVAAIGYEWYSNKKGSSRQKALAEIDREYQQRIATVEKQKSEIEEQLRKLEGKGQNPEDQVKNTAELRVRYDALKPDFQGLEGKYEAFAQRFPNGGNEVAIALTRAAKIHLEGNRTKEASVLLEKVLAMKPVDPLILGIAGYTLVQLRSNEGKWDEALALCDQIASQAPEDSLPDLKLLKARILFAKKDIEGGRQVIDQLIKDHPASNVVATAKSLRAAIR
jgi:predicted negative regulator of RcsB-dependent stress response